MSLFGGKKVKGAQDAIKILTAALDLLKNGTQPHHSIRDAVSQAMKDLSYGEAEVGKPGEVCVTNELVRYGETGVGTRDALEEWGKNAGIEAIRKAFDNALACLK